MSEKIEYLLSCNWQDEKEQSRKLEIRRNISVGADRKCSPDAQQGDPKPRLIRRKWELDQYGGLIISSLPEDS
jgi:hypothetical protein